MLFRISSRFLKYSNLQSVQSDILFSRLKILQRCNMYERTYAVSTKLRKTYFNFSEFLSTRKYSEVESQSNISALEKPEPQGEIVNIIFVSPEGEEIPIQGKVGDNVMQLGMDHEVGMEGACEGQLACTTCHIYVDENYSKYIKEAEAEEEDLLDNAPFLKPNSRLSCQLTLTKDLEGMRFVLPPATINFFVDGHTPKKH